MRRAFIAMLGVLLVAVAAGPVAVAEPRPTSFNFTLSGDQVVPGPGDPDGFSNGAASLDFSKRSTFCAGTAPQNVERPYTSLELRQAPAGEAGPLVAKLTGGATPQSGCARLEKKQLRDIQEDPDQYYLEAKNAEFPNGAIRGQLA